MPWSTRQEVTLHYATGSTSQTPRSIQDFHMDGRGWADVGYNFLVDHEGTAYEGRGWLTVGAHAAPRNQEGVGICFIGGDNMTAAAKATVVQLYDEACDRAGRTLDRLGHRDINSTSCPGTDNYTWWTSPNFRDAAGATEVSDMLGLELGDEGPAVKVVQLYVKNAGFLAALGKSGVDSVYGPATAEGVRLARAYVGSRAEKGYGDKMTPDAVEQLHRAHAKRQAEDLIAALDLGGGTGGTLPATVRVSGELEVQA